MHISIETNTIHDLETILFRYEYEEGLNIYFTVQHYELFKSSVYRTYERLFCPCYFLSIYGHGAFKHEKRSSGLFTKSLDGETPTRVC